MFKKFLETETKTKTIVKPHWIYLDENNLPTYGITKHHKTNGDKYYRQWVLITDEWTRVETDGVAHSLYANKQKILYNLPFLLKPENNTIWIVEGEKCCDRLNEILPKNHFATTNVGGANKQIKSYSVICNKTVYIIPDNDLPGRNHATKVYTAINKNNNVKIIELPGLSEKHDIYDWIEHGHTWNELETIVNNTNGHIPDWLPKEESKEEIKSNDIFDKFLSRYYFNAETKEYLDITTKSFFTDRTYFRDHVISEFNINPNDFPMFHGKLITRGKGKHFDLFNTSLGLHRIESEKEIYEIDNKIYFAKNWKPILNPIYKPMDDNGLIELWKPICSIFTDVILAFYGIQRFLRNLILTIKANRSTIQPLFLVVYGKQGIGKDKTIIKYLTEWINDFYINHNANGELLTDSRNFKSLQKKILLLFPEMHKLDQSDVKQIKSIVDCDRTISYRPMRTNDFIEFPNYLNFVGSSNEHLTDIIKDNTGYRRWIELEVKQDFKSWKTIRDLIYSYPIDRLLESVNLEEDEKSIEYINSIQSEYIEQTPIELFWNEKSSDWKDYLEIKTSSVYRVYSEFCKDNGFKPMNNINFGKQIRTLIESFGGGYVYQKSHRLYKMK